MYVCTSIEVKQTTKKGPTEIGIALKSIHNQIQQATDIETRPYVWAMYTGSWY